MINWTVAITVVGIALGIASLAATVYLRQRKLFVWTPGDTYSLADLMENPDEGLELRFKGRPLETASATYVSFRNAGNVVVRKEDFAPNLTISVLEPESEEPYPILSAQVIDGSDPLDELTPIVHEHTVEIPSALWNRNDFLDLHVLYEGRTDAEVEARGRILDAPPLRRVVPAEKRSAIFNGIGWTLGLGAFAVFSLTPEESRLSDQAVVMVLLVLLVFWILPSIWNSNIARLLRGLPTKPSTGED